MERRVAARERGRRHRARRWAKEILLAVALTIAAAVFIAAALLQGSSDPEDKAPVAAVRKGR